MGEEYLVQWQCLQTRLLRRDRDNFDFEICDCIDGALSILGESLKELVSHDLEMEYHLSSKNLAKESLKLEEGLRAILGDFVAASVLTYVIGNISEPFGINRDGCSGLAKKVDHLREAKKPI
jgi:hypothetical protein